MMITILSRIFMMIGIAAVSTKLIEEKTKQKMRKVPLLIKKQ
jgi:peptidoglycan/LPS O-acetylase OafA/YrhL